MISLFKGSWWHIFILSHCHIVIQWHHILSHCHITLGHDFQIILVDLGTILGSIWLHFEAWVPLGAPLVTMWAPGWVPKVPWATILASWSHFGGSRGVFGDIFGHLWGPWGSFGGLLGWLFRLCGSQNVAKWPPKGDLFQNRLSGHLFDVHVHRKVTFSRVATLSLYRQGQCFLDAGAFWP